MLLLEAERAAEAWAPPAAPRARGWQRLRTERVIVFGLAVVVYVALAAYLALGQDLAFQDGLSRVANAQYVIASRDRHLAAVGFVWNPLPSLVLVPFIPLRALWPELVSTGLLGGISSGLFMAGAVGLVRGILADLGLGRVTRLSLTLLFAMHPMIAFYAGSGMSEAALIFFGLLTTRSLTAWLGGDGTRALMHTGFGLAGAYATRYEALAPGLAVLLLVPVVTALRASGTWRERRAQARADLAVVAAPFLLAFMGWAVLSRVIVKQWFPTLQSQYGNTAQVGHSKQFIEDQTGHNLTERASYLLHQILGLEPAIAGIVLLAVAVLVVRRDLRVIAPIAVLGAISAFDAAAFLTGSSFGWLRFQISVVPLAFALVGTALAHVPRRSWLRGLALLIAVALTVPAMVSASATMMDRKLGREETLMLRSIVRPSSLTTVERSRIRRFDVEREVARSIDQMHLRDGAVLTDAAWSFGVLVASHHPTAFLITPDQDFEPALADPVTFHAQYILVPDPAQATYDAVDLAYPHLYKDGWPGGELVKEWPGRSAAGWRLYRLPTVSR